MWLLFRNIDLGSVGARIATADNFLLVGAAVLIVGQYGLQAVRWRLILNWLDGTLPLRRVLRFTWEGFFFSQALPSSIGGDAIRMLRAANAVGSPRTGIESVLFDRFMGVAGLIGLVGLAMLFWGRTVSDPMLFWIILAVVITGIVGIAFFLALSRLPGWLQHLTLFAELAGVSGKALRLTLHAFSPMLLAMAIAGHTLSACAFYCLGLGLGLSVTFAQCLLFVPTALLVTLIPISIAGWGLRENAVVGLFATVGVPGDGALGMSILYGLICVVVSLPGGVLWVMRRQAADPNPGTR